MANGASSTSQSKETVTLRLPSGEMVDAIVPAGFSDEDLKSYVRMKQPDLFGPPAGVQKPQVDMQTGAAPVATSFATQLSNLPRNLWEGSFFGELGNPRVKAEHEQRIKAMEAPGMEGVKNTFQAANPIVSNESGVDWGATAANLLPYAASARGLRTPEISTSDALAAAKAIGKTALKDAAAHVPVAGRLVQRPSIMDYVRAAQTKATPPTVEIPVQRKVSPPPITGFKGPYVPEPEPTPAPRQVSPPPLRGFKGPYEPPPEPAPAPSRKVSPPPVTGFKGPYKPEEVERQMPEISPSKVSTTPPKGTPMSKSDILARLRANAQRIEQEGTPPAQPTGRPLQVGGQTVPAGADLTEALQKSLPQNRIEGKIMQVVRREGTLGMDRLMEAPELKGLSRQEVEAAATELGNSKKLWVPTKEADAHGPAGIISLAIRKK